MKAHKMKTRLAVAVLLCPLAIAPAMAAGPGKVVEVQVTEQQLNQLDVTPAREAEITATKTAIGQIAFNEDASTVVLTPFSGRVTRLLKKVGDDVKRGDPLFEIDSPEVGQAQADFLAALTALEKTRSQLSFAKRALDRQVALFADKATSQRDVDQARNDFAAGESDVATANNTVTSARNKLRIMYGRDGSEVARIERERTINPVMTIDAQIDGTIVNRKVGPGQFVRADAGDALYSIADLSVMWLKAFVPETDIPSVKIGQELSVRVMALPNRVFTARVSSIGASSDQQTRRIVVRSEIANPDRVLKAEMFATFGIGVGTGVPCPVVPSVSVIREGESAVVWVEREPLVFERRAVKLGTEAEGYVQVVSGLRKGERVVGRGAVFVDNEVK
jgi:cobalt-zinc-cadmium efflux system membrane fusion protein